MDDDDNDDGKKQLRDFEMTRNLPNFDCRQTSLISLTFDSEGTLKTKI